MVSKSVYFYGLLIAGVIFIAIAILSIYYSNSPVKVDVDGVINPNSVDILSPNMESGNTAFITVSGSLFNMSIIYPNKTINTLTESSSNYSLNLIAKEAGEYFIEINNIGNSDILVDGYAFTKASTFTLIGQIMLIITGVVIVALGIRTGKT
ncbi:MAG TPA: hypothetical protein VLA48_01325 [Nitrososphaeraceae archaeon]|nr:hypothetical protein [Nitrososphaeraceae archaeon]